MMAVLRRIAMRGFKSLLDVELELPRIAVMAGPNAAGKSNLLDGLQMLARAGTQRTLAEALAPPIRGFPAEAFALPPGGLAELLTTPSASFSLEADFELRLGTNGSAPERSRYRIGVQIDPDAGRLSVEDEFLSRMTKTWQPKDNARIEVIDGELHVRRSGSGGRPPHEPLGLNHTLLSDARLSGAGYPLFEAVRAELRDWQTYFLDPQEAMREPVPPREVTSIGPQGEHLAPFLYGLKLREPERFDAVARALKAIIPAVGDLDVDLDAKRGTLDIQIDQDGTTFSSRIVSEGTLRVLGLCAIAVTADTGLVAFEEPENGVQPQRIDRIAELLASVTRRSSAQMVVTTHSPEFVAAMLARAGSNADIGVFSIVRRERATEVRRLDHLDSIWQQKAIDELLSEPDPQDKAAALARRGWLDL